MTPEEIVEYASTLGLLLYKNGNQIDYFGQLPPNFVELFKAWLPYKPMILEYLENPVWGHRVRLAKAQAAASKKRLNLPCVYLGDLLNAKPACGCGALHGCAKYGQAVLTGSSNQYRVCSRCPDYVARESS